MSGHLVLHGDSGEDNAAVEGDADEFAAAFLTPAAATYAALLQQLDQKVLGRLGRTWGISPRSLVRRMAERRRNESSARRALQRLTITDDQPAARTSAYSREMLSLHEAADRASDHGAGVPAVAEAFKFGPPQVRDLLGGPDQRPVMCHIRSQG